MTARLYSATNPQGRTTYLTSVLPPAELVWKLTGAGWTQLREQERRDTCTPRTEARPAQRKAI
jgi:hypothetical protein